MFVLRSLVVCREHGVSLDAADYIYILYIAVKISPGRQKSQIGYQAFRDVFLIRRLFFGFLFFHFIFSCSV